MKPQNFKTCPMCLAKWTTRESFLDDPDLLFNGYQPVFGILDEGFLYFTHQTSRCGSTLTMSANNFSSLGGDNQSCNCQKQHSNDDRVERKICQLIKDRHKSLKQTATK